MMASFINNFSIVSYNCHGFNQGKEGLSRICSDIVPEVIFIQEHWLSSINNSELLTCSHNYTCYFSSAMDDVISRGILRGRPFGGVAIIVRNNLVVQCKLIAKSERFIAISIGRVIFINIYGSSANKKDDKLSINADMLSQIDDLLSQHSYMNNCVMGGDFDADIRKDGDVSQIFSDFLVSHGMVSSIGTSPYRTAYTYCNTSLGGCSTIDYFAFPQNVAGLVQQNEVLDVEPNFSDHYPVMLTLSHEFVSDYMCLIEDVITESNHVCMSDEPVVKHLRWDHADVITYYFNTLEMLTPIYNSVVQAHDTVSELLLNSFESLSITQSFQFKNLISKAYNDIVSCLNDATADCIPVVSKNFYKYWWDQELKSLKSSSISAHKAWREAGSPTSGDLFETKRQTKSEYRNKIRQNKAAEVADVNNRLHDALLRKDPENFWKSWRSKFGTKTKIPNIIDGSINHGIISDKFGAHFAKVCCGNSAEKAAKFKSEYDNMLHSYSGYTLTKDHLCTSEHIDSIVNNLQFGKAAGIDGITAEHIVYSHPIIVMLLVKLFNMMILLEYIPIEFGLGLSIPLPKVNFSADLGDYRCITISPVISKIFELHIANVLNDHLSCSNWQLGFKKKLSCSHAIYAVRKTVDYFVSNESTVNVCTMDISKAFDKINQHCLLLKLAERRIPINFLLILELWFTNIFIKVKWGNSVSRFFRLISGIRQGGILSPILFAIYVDNVVSEMARSKLGCYIKGFFAGVWLYADDVVLLSASVSELQLMIDICVRELDKIDLCLNVQKCNCLRIGRRFNARCSRLFIGGETVPCNNEVRYLGISIKSARTFKCIMSMNKQKFYRAANCIISKVGCKNVSVLTALLLSKCVPIIMYGLPACCLTKTEKTKLDNSLDVILAKVFGTFNKTILRHCLYYCDILPLSWQLDLLKMKFLIGLDQLSSINTDYYFLNKVFCRRELVDLYQLHKIDLNSSTSHCKRRYQMWNEFESSLFT